MPEIPLPTAVAVPPHRTTTGFVWGKAGPKTILNKSLSFVKAAIAQSRAPTMLTDTDSDLTVLGNELTEHFAAMAVRDVAKDAGAVKGPLMRASTVQRSASVSSANASRWGRASLAFWASAAQRAANDAAAVNLEPVVMATAKERRSMAAAIHYADAHKQQQQQPLPRTTVARTASSLPATIAENQPKKALSWDCFEKIRPIGSGSYGCVTLCRHKDTGAPCVIKQVNKAFTYAKQEQQHAINEKEVLNMLTETGCPFSIHAHGYFQDADTLNYVLEYVPGGELFTYMVQFDKFDDEEAKFFVAQLAVVLEHMHDRDIAYRDIKPENMLVDADGYIKVCDFGFARSLTRGQRAYTMCGTPEYIAPEILRGKGHDFGADIWSLGIFAYELLVGHTPFEGGCSRDTHVRILSGVLKFPDFVSPLARDFISQLLVDDVQSRLGCGRDGFGAIFGHPWLRTVDLAKLRRKEILSPIDVRVRSPFDSQNFDDVPAEALGRAAQLQPITPDMDNLFADFDHIARPFMPLGAAASAKKAPLPPPSRQQRYEEVFGLV